MRGVAVVSRLRGNGARNGMGRAPMRANGQLQHADFLLVGGGLACATAAETLRTASADGSIVMLSAEPLPP